MFFISERLNDTDARDLNFKSLKGENTFGRQCFYPRLSLLKVRSLLQRQDTNAPKKIGPIFPENQANR